ncbi:hypothetical protein F2Q69_00058427 [Brassica cretica]|uniref:C3HC-type domain-containing protein n=1 Tax=Brassica cretica TaxID=69181 RepID=A0A8S9REZ3_BRACR|nr:hypothetical protein F2Q69_00058427 [Brassica cretica]
MAQDSEKRFHQIMDKLFTPSKSPLPSSSSTSSPVEQQSRGKKRLNPSSALALVEPKTALATIDRSLKAPATGTSQSGLCRPWDRGDLMRRLATFKSMTWFAKPQVISALNCARRGWVNADTDTISCESCGAHLYFSAPASWSKQQVEKAASVFSLKLDNGHKLLCPWIENSCEETLSEFPSMTPQDLVERHEERWAMSGIDVTRNLGCKVMAIKQPSSEESPPGKLKGRMTSHTTATSDSLTNFDFSQIEISGLQVPEIRTPKVPYRLCPSPRAILWRTRPRRSKARYAVTNTEIIVREGDEDGRTIAEVVKELGASMILVGLHQNSFLYRWAMSGIDVTRNLGCKVMAIKQPSSEESPPGKLKGRMTSHTTATSDSLTNFDFSQIEISGLQVPEIRTPKVPYRLCPSPRAILWRTRPRRSKARYAVAS